MFDPYRVGPVYFGIPTVGVAHGYLIRPLRGRKAAPP